MCLCVYVVHYVRAYLHDVRRACRFEGWSGVEVKHKDETHSHATSTMHVWKPWMHTLHTRMHAIHARHARLTRTPREQTMHVRYSRTPRTPCTHATWATLCTPSVACVRSVHGIRACVVCVRGMSAWLACVACIRAYVWGVHEWRAGMRDGHACVFYHYLQFQYRFNVYIRMHGTHTRLHAYQCGFFNWNRKKSIVCCMGEKSNSPRFTRATNIFLARNTVFFYY